MKKIVLLLSMGLLLFSCGPQENPDHHLPSVSTGTVTNITTTTATCSGNVTSDGGSSVTSRGVCWSTTQNPTTANSKTIDDLAQKTKAVDGTGLGTYNSDITGLSTNTTYYVRAYATNSQGTAYGEQRAFTTNAELTIPSVTTGDVTNITTTTADCSGNVTSDGGSSVTARGVYWSTSENPTTSNSKTTDGTGLGAYTGNITGLYPNTTYYVRAYATNAQGIAYGEQKLFKTNRGEGGETFTDYRDGHQYETVTIGEQVWMAENLAYLPSVVGRVSESSTEPYYYVYGYIGTDVAAAKERINYQTYGVLYNWPAALTACPEGWHLPSDAEWTQLENYLISNGYNYDGTTTGDKIAISLASATGWVASGAEGAIGNSNTAYDAYRNKSGFAALPGGYRTTTGGEGGVGYYGRWWSSTEYTTSLALIRRLDWSESDVERYHRGNETGFSVRCLQGYTLPIVNTGDVTYITETTANFSGNVISDGGTAVTARGVCWSISENPTTSNSKTTDGTGLGTYNSDITGLSTNTTYYVRAYATNSQGTAYGEQKSFRTYGTFSDSRDGHVYKIVTIGSQVWMVENLAYLPSVVGPATGSKEDPYYYVYGYDGTVVADAKTYVHTPGDYGEYTPEGAPINSYATYGVLYNWPAAMTACPKGWHLPSDAEWTTLIDYLGGTYFGGGKMKEVGTAHWESPNKGATNDSGFTALPGGFRLDSGIFYGIGTTGNWWSSTQYDTNYAWHWQLYDYISGVDCKNSNKEYGFSVRCLQD